MDKLGDLLKEVKGPENILQARIVLDKTNGILYVNDVPLLAYVSYDMELEGLGSNDLMKLNIGIFVGAMEVIDNYEPSKKLLLMPHLPGLAPQPPTRTLEEAGISTEDHFGDTPFDEEDYRPPFDKDFGHGTD